MKPILSEGAAGRLKYQRASGLSNSNLLSAISYLLFYSSLWARMNWARQDLFGDLRVRYGIKLGLAGLLALFMAQLMSILEPCETSWLTVLKARCSEEE